MTAASPVQAFNFGPVSALPERLRFPAALCALVLASLLLRIGSATPDVSWLIDMCVRMLNGERAYIDIFETTPPVPVLLYMPGAWLETYVGVPAEIAVDAYAYLVYLGVLGLSQRLLPRRLEGFGPSAWFIVFPLGVYLFVLTNDAFAQRETFAVALMTPMICALVAQRQTGEQPEFKWRAAAVLLAGLGAAVKPPLFTVPLLLCGGYLLFTARSLRPLYSSGLIASAFVFTGVTAASFWAFPAYFDGVYQVMRDVYVPIRHHVFYGVWSDSFIFSLTCAALVLLRPAGTRYLREADKFFLIAAAGFAVAYFYQAKYFDYHVIPIGLFCFMVGWSSLLLALKDRSEATLLKRFPVVKPVVFAIVSLGLLLSFDDGEPTLRDRSWAKTLDRPTAMAISAGYITGFPLAREINAQWINRVHCQWAVTYPDAVMMRQRVPEAQRRLYRAYQERELERTANVVAGKKPEIIIQSTTPTGLGLEVKLLERSPALFEDYTIVAEEGVFRIWRRTDALTDALGAQ